MEEIQVPSKYVDLSVKKDKKLISILRSGIENAFYIGNFGFLLTLYLLSESVKWIGRRRYFPNTLRLRFGPQSSKLYKKLLSLVGHSDKTINRLNYIKLAIKNMLFKKTRTMITVGGMAVGIGVIVFLLSIGFGVQELVISRVARLEELKQTDISVQTGSQLKLTDKTLSDVKGIPSVADAIPLISVVGRVQYNSSSSDVAVYGVTTDYLKKSAIKPVRGKIFESNALVASVTRSGVVAGVSTSREQSHYNETIRKVNFLLQNDIVLPVYSGPTEDATIIGYTMRKSTQGSTGTELWGESYASESGVGEEGVDPSGTKLGRWIKSVVPLWQKEICIESNDPDCVGGQYVVDRSAGDNQQTQKQGYITEKLVSVSQLDGKNEVKKSTVLGVATASAVVVSSTPTTSDDVQLTASDEALLNLGTESLVPPVQKVKLAQKAVKQAVVNRAFLKVIGLPESSAVGKEFSLSYVISTGLIGNDKKVESEPSTYTIVGIDPEVQTPFMYVPFVDIRSLGVNNFSQIKVVADNDKSLSKIRKQIEVFGYSTSSVVDTVAQINNLFVTARIFLALLGGVALAVAALGMFNTLTVSLLERTREVGLLKAMGMKSYEVKELFLTESMIMGFFGGFFGIILGILGGNAVSLILSLWSLSRGSGIVSISSTPLLFIILTMAFSMLVGLITGIFPARRATKISALNALRYE